MTEKAFRASGLPLSEPVKLGDMENVTKFPVCVFAFLKLTSLTLDQAVDKWIVQGTHHHVHRLGEQSVRKRAQFPIPQMRRRDEYAPTARFRRKVVFKPLIFNPFTDVFTGEGGEAGHREQ